MLEVSDFLTYFPIEFYVQLLSLAMVAILDHLGFFAHKENIPTLHTCIWKKLGKHKTRQYYTQFWNMAIHVVSFHSFYNYLAKICSSQNIHYNVLTSNKGSFCGHFMPFSTIFQILVYHSSRFYKWRQQEKL